MRLVLDTNTVLSGLLWQGNPGRLIDAAQERRISVATSVPLLAELRGVILRRKFASEIAARGLDPEFLFEGFSALAELVVPASIPPTVLRDPADDQVLACALGAGADMIVTGDHHLLELGAFQGILIVAAAAALERIAAAAR